MSDACYHPPKKNIFLKILLEHYIGNTPIFSSLTKFQDSKQN